MVLFSNISYWEEIAVSFWGRSDLGEGGKPEDGEPPEDRLDALPAGFADPASLLLLQRLNALKNGKKQLLTERQFREN